MLNPIGTMASCEGGVLVVKVVLLVAGEDEGLDGAVRGVALCFVSLVPSVPGVGSSIFVDRIPTPKSQLQIGRLTLWEVLIWRLCTFSQPPGVFVTITGSAITKFSTMCCAVSELRAIFIELDG